MQSRRALFCPLSAASCSFFLCITLLVAFTVIAWTAVSGKSATFDESLHLTAAWAQKYNGDFRCDTDHPPLWKSWAMLSSRPGQLLLPLDSNEWKTMARDMGQEFQFARDAVFPQTLVPGTDPLAALDRARAMMLIAGVLLGVLVAFWSWKLSGGIGAVLATALFCLDPNFLGHAALMKNDVFMSLAYVGLLYAVWLLGRRATWPRWLAAGVLCGIAVNVKFNGVLMVLIAAVVLIARALPAEPWIVLGRTLVSRLSRFVAAVGLLVGMAIMTWAIIWCCYGFRFNISPDPNISLDMDPILHKLAEAQIRVGHLDQPSTEAERLAWQPSPVIRMTVFFERHHVLPQGWICGLVMTDASAYIFPSYFFNEVGHTGWWYYFPYVILYKTPVVTLLIMLAAVAMAILRMRHRTLTPSAKWSIWCLAAPAIGFLAIAISSNLDIGIRHILPIYPFIYIGIAGVLAGSMNWARNLRNTTYVAVALAVVALSCETLSAYPNYIAFFNRIAGGPRGGLDILSDSNLDWGQDLKLLAAWQRQHPDVPLYLCYFGTADPHAYGLHYIDMRRGALDISAPVYMPEGPGVMAISATHLQSEYLRPSDRQMMQSLRRRPPLDVLGGTIYLFDYSP